MLDIILVNLILIVGAVVQGVVGYGIALICAPLLFLIDPTYIPAPMIMASMLLNFLLMHRERQALQFGDITWASVGNAFGVACAALVLLYVAGDKFNLVFGGLILFAVALSLSGYKPAITPGSSIIAGFASGFMGTCTSVGGPPVALLYQSASIQVIRANLPAFFFFSSILALIALAATGHMSWIDIRAFLAGIPGILLGFYISHYAKGWLGNLSLRPFILGIASISALWAIIDGIWF